jgi:poly-gamma-glutamate synthesis protein (capsule biosynthesis protein)
MPPRTGPLDRAELDRFLRAVRDLDRRVDVVVVLPHWGTQYTHRPEPVQRRVGRALVRAGADLVVGGHPHWVQGVDLVDGVPVAHSLGNFVFDMDFMPQTMEGVVLEATFTGGELRAVGLVPYRLDRRTFAPRPMHDAAGRGVLADVWSTSGVGYRR